MLFKKTHDRLPKLITSYTPINQAVLGRTLPSLLDEACDRNPNVKAVNDWHHGQWRALSTQALRNAMEGFALGLIELGLRAGDRVAMLLHSDTTFCIGDLGCLLAGLVTVPIDLTQTLENIRLILHETQAKVLLVSNTHILHRIHRILHDSTALEIVILVEEEGISSDGDDDRNPTKRGALTTLSPSFLQSNNPALNPLSFEAVMTSGHDQRTPERVQQLREAIAPMDLATLIYIAGPTRTPRGVMLTHENITADILSAFDGHPTLERGDNDIALSFLPLTHIFARAFFYGHLNYGHSIYFSSPHRVMKHLRTVKPTIFITVPRLLEKVYEQVVRVRPERERVRGIGKVGKVEAMGEIGGIGESRMGKFSHYPHLPPLRHRPHLLSLLHLPRHLHLPHLPTLTYIWALKLAHRYRLGHMPGVFYAVQLKLADRLVFSRWREVFGGRIKSLICGGAALNSTIANVFSAAGIPVLQGYGLTETSSVLAYNRGRWNRAGTVGRPIPGVEVAIAPDGEVLIKAPYVMQGYYNDPEATCRAIDADGWFHTGDVGDLSTDGFLSITGVKKNLFKLTTGKYVAALALEQEVERSPLVHHAIAIGANRKFCAMLIVPNLETLNHQIQDLGYILSPEALVHHPCAIALYQALIDDANCHLPYWSTVRQFRLLNVPLTVENAMLTPQGTVNRAVVMASFKDVVAEIYGERGDRGDGGGRGYRGLKRLGKGRGDRGAGGDREGWDDQPALSSISSPLSCPDVPAASCPITAQSLMHS